MVGIDYGYGYKSNSTFKYAKNWRPSQGVNEYIALRSYSKLNNIFASLEHNAI